MTVRQTVVLALLLLYTAFSAGPFVWVATMSVRTTTEITRDRYAWPKIWHWDKFVDAWFGSGYATYFGNSTLVVLSAVAVLTFTGAAAAYALARYRFPGNRTIYFVLFSTIVFPPQITIIALFQILVQYGLYNSLLGLTLVYVTLQLPLTIYILETFFRRIPGELFDAARIDGYGEIEVFWKIALPIALPALSTTVILNTILLWNEFLYAVVLITEESKRTLPLGIQRFMGDQLEDVGMIATGLMIAVVPVVLIYAFFSEKLIQGMTAGAMK
jgi:ABC-type glycerol-3-phosphate transport system permease component